MIGAPWTPNDDRMLRQMWVEDGLSMGQIGRHLRRSRGSVASRIGTLGMRGLGHRLAGQSLPDDYRREFASPLAPQTVSSR